MSKDTHKFMADDGFASNTKPCARVMHGGGWIVDALEARLDRRDFAGQGYRSSVAGFRVVAEPDPKFRELKIQPRVVRGGAWIDDQSFTRAHYRYLSRPNLHNSLIGFRVVAEPEPVKKPQHQHRHRRVVHGGSHLSARGFARVWTYLRPRPDHCYRSIGFRVIRTL